MSGGVAKLRDLLVRALQLRLRGEQRLLLHEHSLREDVDRVGVRAEALLQVGGGFGVAVGDLRVANTVDKAIDHLLFLLRHAETSHCFNTIVGNLDSPKPRKLSSSMRARQFQVQGYIRARGGDSSAGGVAAILPRKRLLLNLQP